MIRIRNPNPANKIMRYRYASSNHWDAPELYTPKKGVDSLPFLMLWIGSRRITFPVSRETAVEILNAMRRLPPNEIQVLDDMRDNLWRLHSLLDDKKEWYPLRDECKKQAR